MVRYESVKSGIARYADNEIIGRLPDGTLKKVLIGSVIAIAMKRIDDAIKPYMTSDIVSAMKIVDGDIVDIDILGDALKTQISEHGLKIDVPGGINMSFGADDIDTIIRYIKEA